MATIWQRPEGSPGNKRWVASVRRRGFKPRSKSFSRYDLAQAWARRMEVEIEAGTYQDTRRAEQMTFAEAVRWYREAVLPDLRGKSLLVEGRRLDKLERSPLAPLAVGRIQPKDILAYLKERAREIEASPKRRVGVESDRGRMRSDTLRLDASRISAIYRELRIRQGLPVVNPVVREVRPLAGHAREVRITREQARPLLEAARPVLRLAIEFGWETAVRPGELVLMDWGMVDLKNRTLKIPAAKTEPRKVSLSKHAVRILRKLGVCKAGRVWPWRNETGYSGAVRRAADKAGLALRAQDGRHIAVTELLESGMSIPETAAISGHKTWAMLKRYTSMQPPHLIRRLDETEGRRNDAAKTAGSKAPTEGRGKAQAQTAAGSGSAASRKRRN